MGLVRIYIATTFIRLFIFHLFALFVSYLSVLVLSVFISDVVFSSVCILPVDDDDDIEEGSAVYRLQWFPESCSDGRTALGEAPLVAMSASTQVGDV